MRYVIEATPAPGSRIVATGRGARVEGHSIGGKTGTAQQGRGAADPLSVTFFAYIPVENPQYLVMITLDRVERSRTDDISVRRTISAGSVIAPVLRDFMQDLIRMRGIHGADGMAPDWHATLDAPLMPDFSGQRLSEVVPNLNNAGSGGWQVTGSGTVISHTTPAAGSPMPTTNSIFFHMDSATRVEDRMVTMPNVEGMLAEDADFLLRELGLPPVVFRAPRERPVGEEFSPVTGAALTPLAELPDAPAAPVRYTIYRQFPRQGAEIEMGTQVVLRAR
jgi:hypothetical protein